MNRLLAVPQTPVPPCLPPLRAIATGLLAWALLLAGVPSRAQDSQVRAAAPLGIDDTLWRFIQRTPAFDNHAHPLLSPPAMATDRNFDALPVDNMEPETDPLAWRPDNPGLLDAWRALFGFVPEAVSGDAPTLPLSEAQAALLEQTRSARRQEKGSGYAAWVLDQAGIGTMLANRVAMGTGIQPPRFRWVPYLDALLFPLNNAGLAAENPDRRQFFALEDKLRSRYLDEAGLKTLPPTLDGYLRQVVLSALARHRAGGAVAEKFEVAYLRSFDFGDPPESEAARVYARWSHAAPQTTVSSADYKLLQDFLFRRIALECGRLGMAVYLHGMSGGGRYFSIAGVNPMLLEPVLNDPRLNDTHFVLLHGGWPYVREAGALLQKPNVYVDISQQALIFPAHTLAGWLREWLETYPEKVLFATDGYPFTPALGWEEATWLAARNGRAALGVALTGMMRDGEITPGRAQELAAMVLHGNAESLYNLPVATLPR